MTRPMPRLVVFDLAGTTMEDDGTVAACFQRALSSGNLDAGPGAISGVRGASKREAFRTLAGDPELGERLFHRFIADLLDRYAGRPPREVPGASAVFAWLREEGIKVALNTGFEREVAGLLVRGLGWDPAAFDAIVCGDEVEAGRPSPAMLREAMGRTGTAESSRLMAVGDTVLDLEAGAAARAGWIVGVTSGAHSHTQLLAAPHTHLVASVADIREILR